MLVVAGPGRGRNSHYIVLGIVRNTKLVAYRSGLVAMESLREFSDTSEEASPQVACNVKKSMKSLFCGATARGWSRGGVAWVAFCDDIRDVTTRIVWAF